MPVNIPIKYSHIPLLFALVVGSMYFGFFAKPAFQSGDNLYVWAGTDSFRYIILSQAESIPELVKKSLGIISGDIGYSNFGMFGITFYGWVLWKLVGNAFPWAILFCNSILLYFALENYRKFFYISTSNERYFRTFLLFLFINPAISISLTSLNKEIIGIFIVSSLLINLHYKKYLRYVLVSLIALLFRDAYFLVAILFFAIRRLPINKMGVLLIMSLLLPLVAASTKYMMSAHIGDEGNYIFLLLRNIDTHYLGYILTYIPKLSFQLFAGVYPASFIDVIMNTSINPVASILAVSSVMYFLMFFIIILNRYFAKRVVNTLLLDMFFAYTVIFCTLPFPTHRYFLPIYPLVVGMTLIPGAKYMANSNSWNFKILKQPICRVPKTVPNIG